MLRLIATAPLFVTDANMKDTHYTLEIGTLLRVDTMHSRHGAIKATVYAGKYEGLRGNVPASFCEPDIMQVM